jgi:hypothetical protein
VSTAEAIALQLEIERCLRNREDALAIRLLEQLRKVNSQRAREQRA